MIFAAYLCVLLTLATLMATMFVVECWLESVRTLGGATLWTVGQLTITLPASVAVALAIWGPGYRWFLTW